jgi:hypothetical protein
MLCYRMSLAQTATFDAGGHSATEIATAIAEILRAMTEHTVVVVDTQGLIAFVVEPADAASSKVP